MVHEAKTCRAAVLRVAALYVALWRAPCAEDTAAYGRARAHLPTPVLKRLALEAGRNLEREAPADWRGHGRRVRLVDGTTLTLADTPANQRADPQPPCQKPGLGLSMIRLVVLLG